jgi:3-hydroxyacyl-[acyl-carrier-protein] dehydratase
MSNDAPMNQETRAAVTLPIDVNRIVQMLPHRFPFLLIDRVVAFDPHKRLTAIKNVTINEPFFQGHFPNHPVMPGVLIIEALAQASGVLNALSHDGSDAHKLYYLVKVDNARFSRTVVPGDQLTLEVEQKRMLRRMGLYLGVAKVDGVEVASAEILCAEGGR